jgi:DNA polymerase-3 subunit epsilon
MSSDAVSSMVFVDLETTGGMASVDRITEIGIVELDAQGRMTEWSTLVNPQMPIPPFIQGLTGISNEMVAGAPTFAELADEVMARLKGRLFVAHNARFDHGFLKHSFLRMGMDFKTTVLCTVKLSRKVDPQFNRHGLDALIERHGLRVPAARHRALTDAQLLAQFWRVLQSRLSEEALQQAVDELTGRSVWPAQLAPSLLEELPEAHGVYVMWGDGEVALHIGRGPNVRQKVLTHLGADLKAAPPKRHTHLVRRIETHCCAGELGAALLEARLLHRLKPVHNRGLREAQGRGVCTWRLTPGQGDDGGAVDTLALGTVRDVTGRAEEAVYGLFGTERDALKTLREIAQNARLCLRALGLEAGAPGQPCTGLRQEQCSGVCVGRESAAEHTSRMRRILADWRLPAWPHEGAIKVREGASWHVLDAWRYLGTVHDEAEIDGLLALPRPDFDRDTYKVLSCHLPGLVASAIGPA